MDMKKRGQLTVFVIIAVVVVVGIVFYYSFGDSFLEEKYDPEVEVLREGVLDCLEEEYRESLLGIGIQGGYGFDVPEPYVEESSSFVSIFQPYYYHEGGVKYPLLDDVRNNLADLVTSSSEYCFTSVGEDSDFVVSFDDPMVTVLINDNDVTFTTLSFMTVNYYDKTAIVDLSKSQTIIGSDLKGMHSVAVFIAEYYLNNNEWTPYSEVVDLANEHNVYVNFIDSVDGYENTILISAINEQNSPILYSFRNKFDHEGIGEIAPLLV